MARQARPNDSTTYNPSGLTALAIRRTYEDDK